MKKKQETMFTFYFKHIEKRFATNVTAEDMK